jgi:rod shape-determining protein MreC
VPDLIDSRKRRRRDAVLAIGAFLVALILLLAPLRWNAPIRAALRNTLLWPFYALQDGVAAVRAERGDFSVVRAQRDSLLAVTAAQAVLAEENGRLRALLELAPRAGAGFRAAERLTLGTEAAEGTFLIGLGAGDGVGVGSPVFTAEGLLGIVREVEADRSQVIDWTRPEFRASVMTADGLVYGIVEPLRGGFREADLLVMTGAPFHSDVRPGRLVVTSGRGTLFPRGIPVGTVVSIQDADTGWRKSYVIRPAVRPEAATHVLVGVEAAGPIDLTAVWQPALPAGGAVPAVRPRADTAVRTDTTTGADTTAGPGGAGAR